MFVQKLLLDPEEERRRRVRRARIVRRNRIKREVAKGFPLRFPRVFTANYDDSEVEFKDWKEAQIPFKLTFGGKSEDFTFAQQVKTLSSAKSESFAHPPTSSATLAQISPPEALVKINSKSLQLCAKWKKIYQEVIFRRHEEILAKTPNRKWRQERFGLLLFVKGEFIRASEHLTKAVSLGANSGLCWRKLAESSFHMWENSGKWEDLWACRAAYEQALNHVQVSSNPVALFAYARVLELLGNYTGALTICASILQTFPTFTQLRDIKLRFVVLQRHQLFSATESAKAAILTKCIEFTQELLLDSAIIDGPKHINVLYLHTRLNEMLTELSTAKIVDVLFQELYKIAVKTSQIAPLNVKCKSWQICSDTYTTFAEYFRANGEPVLVSDALSRALELLETLPIDCNSTEKSTNLCKGRPQEQQRKRISIYVVFARNYYQCNQMEKAIRAMEAVYALDPLHTEARNSLIQWFPSKWQSRLELEDASQVQIARVLRGIWDRKFAQNLRREAQRVAEEQFRANPYHVGCRIRVLRLLRNKYVSVFAAQDQAARRIQRSAKRFLYYARMRWKTDDQREKVLRKLINKQQTRKYRYNRQVRQQLAILLPNEYEFRFFREDCSVLRIQRCFRGKRSRQEFKRLRNEQQQLLKRQKEAAQILQRFYRRLCRAKPKFAQPIQRKIVCAKERFAVKLQRLYHHWKNAKTPKHSSLFQVLHAEAVEQRQILVEHASARKIQRFWRRFATGEALGGRVCSQAQIFRAEHLQIAQRRQTYLDLDHAVRILQSRFRGKLLRKYLTFLKNRRLAPFCANVIATLIAKCEKNQEKRSESMAILHSNLDDALFNYPVLVLKGPQMGTFCANSSLQHVISAIQYSAVLKTLICANVDFQDDQILTILQALQTRKRLQIFALGEITKKPTTQEMGFSNENVKNPESIMGEMNSFNPLSSRRLTPLQPSSQLSAMQILSKALCSSNFLLEELYLERNSLLENPKEGEILANIVADYFCAKYGRLHTLVVAHMRFSDANGALLGAALGVNNILQKLDLHGNLLSENAAIAIANDGLSHNKSLRYLNLAENTINSVGGKALFSCLSSWNRTLETLILCNNHLMNDVMPLVIETWQRNAVLETVELAGNLFSELDLTTLQAAAVERRKVGSVAENQELRLLLARKRFGIEKISSPISRKGIGIFASPLRKSRDQKKKKVPLSPNKWVSTNVPKLISPLTYPTMNRQANEVFTTNFSVEKVYAPLKPRKILKTVPLSSARVLPPSKLPALPVNVGQNNRLTW